jgi:hypothetical protein
VCLPACLAALKRTDVSFVFLLSRRGKGLVKNDPAVDRMVFSDLNPRLMVDINQPWTTIASRSPRVVLTWDDLAVLAFILAGSFFYLVRTFRTETIEDGFDLYFVSPQEQAGIMRSSSNDDNAARSIEQELQKSVS